MQNQKGLNHPVRKRLLRVFLSLVAIAVVGFGYLAYQHGAIDTVRANFFLSSCSNAPAFDRPPVNLSDIDEIAPLGNIGVPDHTLPTDHMYFYYDPSLASSPVVAPGNIVVTGVEYSSESRNGQFAHPGDYSVTFTNCRGRKFYFAHLKALAGKLSDQTSNIMKSCTHGNQAQGTETTYCDKNTYITLQPGEQIGIIGVHGDAHAFDFGANQNGYHDPGAADPKFDGDNAVCPLDYFDKVTQAAIYTKVARKAEPRCGQIRQDKAGTVQGSWTSHSDPAQGRNDWNSHLSIVHFNRNPSQGIIGIGGGPLGSPGGLGFKPQGSGSVNREPSQTAVGTLYCYQSDSSNVQVQPLQGQGRPIRLLVKLNSDAQMQVELQPGNCAGSLAFTKPALYYR